MKEMLRGEEQKNGGDDEDLRGEAGQKRSKENGQEKEKCDRGRRGEGDRIELIRVIRCKVSCNGFS